MDRYKVDSPTLICPFANAKKILWKPGKEGS